MQKNRKVTIIGAGIMGLSLAWRCLKAGMEVIVIDQNEIPNKIGSSFDQHRIIRYPYGDLTGYTRLVQDAFIAWDRLWEDLSASYFQKTGILMVGPDNEDNLITLSRKNLNELKLPYYMHDQTELEQKFPNLNFHKGEFGLEMEIGGVLFADKIIKSLYSYLKNNGVEFISHCPVEHINAKEKTVFSRSGDCFTSEYLFLCLGPWVTKNLIPDMDPMNLSKQYVLYFDCPKDYKEKLSNLPPIVDLSTEKGFYSLPPIQNTDFKIAPIGFDYINDPDIDRKTIINQRNETFITASKRFKEFSKLTPIEAKHCLYTVSKDERFTIKQPAENCLAFSGFSGHGFKFGPLIGFGLEKWLNQDWSTCTLQSWAAAHSYSKAFS